MNGAEARLDRLKCGENRPHLPALSAALQAPAWAFVMSASMPSKPLPGPEGLSFANALCDCLACGVIVIDAGKKLVTMTAPAAKMLGLKTGLVLPLSLQLLPAELQKLVCETMSTGSPLVDHLLILAIPGHKPATIRLSVLPTEPGRTGSGMVLVLQDMTPLRRLEQSVHHLDRLASIGTLSASMAHEVRNALVAGKTFVDLLLEKHQDVELVEVVRREISRIDSIVSRMLKFAGPGDAAFASVRLHEILDHSLRLIEPKVEGTLLSLSRSFRASPDLVHCDPKQLQQAFVNLLLNALEAMGENGVLMVATEIAPADTAAASGDPLRKERIRLTIQDNGIGIPPENMERLFEPFFTTKPNGTGLGLAITRRIIQDHGGVISVESAPGKGTAFNIVFPVPGNML